MKTYLKIKIKTLAAEAVLIKREERKWFKLIRTEEYRPIAGKCSAPDVVLRKIFKKDHPLRMSLRQHRIDIVRPECRHSNIAYGYMRGRAYKQIENKCYEQPDWNRVAEIVYKFSGAIPVDVKAHRAQLLENIKTWSKVLPNAKKSTLSSAA